MDASLQARAEQLATEFASQARTAEDLNGLMRLMMKSALERMLNTEMDVHLGRKAAAGGRCREPAADRRRQRRSRRAGRGKRSPNRRNGHSQKTVQGDLGELTLATPRDRDGTFEPQLIAKHQRRVPGFDEKILALYAKGMTTRDIQEIVQELYGVEVSRHAGLGDHRRPRRRSDRLADAAARRGLADRLLRRHRGACARRQRPRVAAHDVRGFGRESGGPEGAAGPVAGRERRGQVLARVPDRSEEPRPARHLRGLRRRADRLPRGDSRGLSPDERAAVHRASGAGGAAVREHRGQPGGGRAT